MTPSARLEALVRASAWFSPALAVVRELDLPSWCIGAGEVRNLVWDELHGYQTPSALSDIDVAYFDARDISAGRDVSLRDRLTEMHPDAKWDVTNQAGVHTWFEATFGDAVAPFLSLEDAVASWPEFATSVGVTLRPDGAVAVIAPHGLDDLFSMVVRRNPLRVSVATYRQRIAQKRYGERWPKVTILPAD